MPQAIETALKARPGAARVAELESAGEGKDAPAPKQARKKRI